MKTLIIALIAIFAADASASSTVVLSETQAVLNVNIAPGNVKFSRADYSVPVVKVLVPELADVTVLDHRNFGEGAPCLASYEAKKPADVIQNRPAIEKITFTVTLSKTVSPDAKNQKCLVYLNETVNGVIRGYPFTHDRSAFIGERNLADCR